MFKLHAHLLAPPREVFEAANRRAPEAHYRANAAAAEHIRGRIASEVEGAGHDPDAVRVVWHRGTPGIGISNNASGERLSKTEFGDANTEPQAIVRGAYLRHLPEAQRVFRHSLIRELGL